MSPSRGSDSPLSRRLILDELFDLSLYEALHRIAPAPERKVLAELIPVERRHLAFWQQCFDLRFDRLDWGVPSRGRGGNGRGIALDQCRAGAERRRFLGEPGGKVPTESPLVSGMVVGISYFLGALVPVLPFLFGAATVIPSVVTAGSVIIAVSTVLSFLSGMEVRRRILTNLVIIAAVGVTYAIGVTTRSLWGISV